VTLYWRTLVAMVGCITYWSGAWDFIDVFLRDWLWSGPGVVWDLFSISSGMVLLVATGTFTAAAGLQVDTKEVHVAGLAGTLHLLLVLFGSLYGQVAFGVGIYNMFDQHMFPQSVWWNLTCVLIGLPLMLGTRTIFWNAGVEAAPRHREGPAGSWWSKAHRYLRAVLGAVGAFVLWKGWEQLLDQFLQLPQEAWREVLYIIIGSIILLLTRTFLSFTGVDLEDEQAGSTDAQDVTQYARVNQYGYTEWRTQPTPVQSPYAAVYGVTPGGMHGVDPTAPSYLLDPSAYSALRPPVDGAGRALKSGQDADDASSVHSRHSSSGASPFTSPAGPAAARHVHTAAAPTRSTASSPLFPGAAITLPAGAPSPVLGPTPISCSTSAAGTPSQARKGAPGPAAQPVSAFALLHARNHPVQAGVGMESASSTRGLTPGHAHKRTTSALSSVSVSKVGQSGGSPSLDPLASRKHQQRQDAAEVKLAMSPMSPMSPMHAQRAAPSGADHAAAAELAPLNPSAYGLDAAHHSQTVDDSDRSSMSFSSLHCVYSLSVALLY